ncbi:MAG: metal ABC transporter ATP-binding protein [Phycisphaerales bacterium]
MGLAVELENLTFRYPGAESAALEGVSLRVEAGERLGILGPNGGGKSTLLKLVMGLLTGHAGRILVHGVLPADARRAGIIGYVPQRPETVSAMPLCVRQMVTLGAAWRVPGWRRVPAALRERAERMLHLTGAAPYADRPIGKLSGGQFQRAMIARALAAEPSILVLDEPTVGIDAAGQAMFADLLGRVHAELRLTVLIVSHDLRAIAAGSDRVACLARRLHSHGSPAGLTPAVLAEVFSHDIAGIAGLTGPVHVDAHSAADCPACGHDAPAVLVPMAVSAQRAAPGGEKP